jgi:hypothetical protein
LAGTDLYNTISPLGERKELCFTRGRDSHGWFTGAAGGGGGRWFSSFNSAKPPNVKGETHTMGKRQSKPAACGVHCTQQSSPSPIAKDLVPRQITIKDIALTPQGDLLQVWRLKEVERLATRLMIRSRYLV